MNRRGMFGSLALLVAAADGAALSGELLVVRDGKVRGRSYGTVTRGPVRLYYDRSGAYGFGWRFALRF
jgi:hypothetical protein